MITIAAIAAIITGLIFLLRYLDTDSKPPIPLDDWWKCEEEDAMAREHSDQISRE